MWIWGENVYDKCNKDTYTVFLEQQPGVTYVPIYNAARKNFLLANGMKGMVELG